MTVGQITNHINVDAGIIQWFFIWQYFVWAAPYQIIVILILLYLKLGVASLVGAFIIFITTPLSYKIAKKMSMQLNKVLSISDVRLKKSNELIQGVKLLKLYGWEDLFTSSVEKVRSREVSEIMKAGVYMIATCKYLI
ncbi:ATP-binding cassette sub-family C member 8-like [Saccoglossus kowalevskii]